MKIKIQKGIVKYQYILIFIIMLGIFGLAQGSKAAIRYVDQTAVTNGTTERGAVWSGTDGDNYNPSIAGSPGAGIGYGTVNAALSAMTSGDDVYIREGSYNEAAPGRTNEAYYIPGSASGTVDDWSSIQSYPDEWAILNAGGRIAGLGVRANNDICPGGACRYYIRIERLEITGAGNVGIWLHTGPFIIRYCYIHDNYAATGNDNPGGIQIVKPRNSVIEYNYFDSNGATDYSSTNNSQIIFYADQAYTLTEQLCTDDWALSDGLCNYNNMIIGNTVRYNKFTEATNRANHAFSHKGTQVINPRAKDSTMNETYKTYGDNIHHNLVLADDLKIQQDFCQVHNNIIPNGKIEVGYRVAAGIMYPTIYNNYMQNIEWGWTVGTSAYWWWGADNTVMFQRSEGYNNILDGNLFSSVAHHRLMSFIWDASDLSFFDVSTINDLSQFYWKNNYIYRPLSSTDVFNTHLSAAGHDQQTMDQMEASHAGFSNNYRKASSESTDSLFEGTSDYQQYIMRGEHQIESRVKIANGGIGINHPYLSGVTIPSYVGPTNPIDHDWVEQVNSFDVAYFTAKASRGNTAYDESWIEGSGQTSDTTAPSTPSGLSVS